MNSLDEKNFGLGIRKNALYAKNHITILESYFHEFLDGNFTNLDNFRKVAVNVETNLENIKVFVEHEEKRQLLSLNSWLHYFFQNHLVDRLGNSNRSRVVSLFKETMNEIVRDMELELNNERRLIGHHQPHISFMKRFQSSRQLNRTIIRDERQFDRLLKSTHDLSQSVLEHAKMISLGSKDASYESHFVREVKELCTHLRLEFAKLLDEEVNSELQETEIIQQIDKAISVAHKYKNERAAHELHEIREHLLHLIKKDIESEKQLFTIAKEVRSYVREAV